MHTPRIPLTLAIVFLIAFVVSGCSLNLSKPQDSGVFYSNLDGEAWEHRVFVSQTEKKTVTIAPYDVLFFTFHPTNESTLYVSTREAGVYKTDDKGRTWTQTTLKNGAYSSFVLDPASPTVQYAASGGTILKSADDGSTWQQVYIERTGIAITSVVIDPINPNVLWAGNSSGGVLKSIDYGNTWELNTIVLEPIRQIIIPQKNSGIIYILLNTQGFVKSIDGGETWNTGIVSGLAQFPGAVPIQSFFLRPQTTGDIIIGTTYGILRSTDGGITWQPVATVLPNNTVPINSVVIHPLNQEKIFFTAGNIFYQSFDGGQTWKTLQTIPTANLITSLVFNPNNFSDLFAGITKITKK